jgi:uncharacterized membrane protein YgdD (TMEM256/DUF423 family)
MYRIWLFLAGLSGCAALIAASYAAHGLTGIAAPAMKNYETASLQHVLHSIAMAIAAGLLIASDGRRSGFGTLVLNLSAFAFLAGIILFSGSLYYEVLRGAQNFRQFVPVGGSLLMAGWVALALSALGIGRAG